MRERLIITARHRGLMTSKLKLIETQFANRCNLECGPAQGCGPVHGRRLKRRLLNWYRIVGANSRSRRDRHMASDCLRLLCDRSKSALFGLEKKGEKSGIFGEKCSMDMLYPLLFGKISVQLLFASYSPSLFQSQQRARQMIFCSRSFRQFELKLIETQFANRCNLGCGPAQ